MQNTRQELVNEVDRTVFARLVSDFLAMWPKRDVFIRTVSGRAIYFLDMEASEISILDIAHSLARLCRYNGHIATGDAIYSVAQHSVLVSDLVDMHCRQQDVAEDYRLALVRAALLHDATEAYIGDITGPLKALLRPIITPIEEAVDLRIAQQFGVPLDLFAHPVIKLVDMSIRRNEAEKFCPMGAEGLCVATEGGEEYSKLNVGIDLSPWNVYRAQRRFLSKFSELFPELRDEPVRTAMLSL